MHRRLLLLGLLSQRQMHGYKLHEFISKRLRHCSDMKKSTAYTLLEKLAEEGYVTAATDRSGNYPERKVYALTPEGRAYFLTLLRENLVSFDLGHDSHLEVGLALMHELPAEERRDLLSRRREHLAEALATLQKRKTHGGSIDLVIERSAALLQAETDWLDANIGRALRVQALYEVSEMVASPSGRSSADGNG